MPRGLCEDHPQGGNSVWGWYVVNTTGPRLLQKRKVDRIVANPPWVAMAEVQAERRKRALEQFAARPDMDLWTGGRDAPHFDIAQLFVKRARQLYLADPERDPLPGSSRRRHCVPAVGGNSGSGTTL